MCGRREPFRRPAWPWRQPGRVWPGLLGALLLALAALPGASQEDGTPGVSAPYTQRLVRQGLAVEFTVAHYKSHIQRGFQKGDDVIVRFKISDATTGMPLSGVSPAAWMDLLPNDAPQNPDRCTERVALFVGESLFSEAELNLNVYYVLALNHDATLTVVDPRFGTGTTELIALVPLRSPGEDWVLTPDHTRLFVSMPEAQRLAMIDTASWEVVTNLEVGPRPSRLAMQPDGAYLWVSYDAGSAEATASGMVVVSTRDLATLARIPTGRGPHDITFSPDSRFAFVTNREAGTVSVIDVRRLAKMVDLNTGLTPTSVAFSLLAQAAYVAHEGDGMIVVIAGQQPEIVARIPAAPGLGQIRFAPGGRLGFVVHPSQDVVYILDAATNRIVQWGKLDQGPDQIAFSNKLAYVRHRDSEIVRMIPLDQVGGEGQPIPIVDFPGGQHPLGQTSRPSLADAIVQASGKNAMLVANPADQAIYFYKEGMAAPMGHFSNYGREPRAVLVVARHLRERTPGVYETAVRLRRPGLYDVAFFLNNPRLVHCFDFAVAATEPSPAHAVHVAPMRAKASLQAGEPVRVQFKVTDPDTHAAKTDLYDVQILVIAPGIWQGRQWARHAGDGVYGADFVLPRPGSYAVYLACPSLELQYRQYLTLWVQSPNGQ
jgi:DNA-binding beta-propeller fold protein YncE